MLGLACMPPEHCNKAAVVLHLRLRARTGQQLANAAVPASGLWLRWQKRLRCSDAAASSHMTPVAALCDAERAILDSSILADGNKTGLSQRTRKCIMSPVSLA